MALELDPPTLIEDAAREENWSPDDWREWNERLRPALETTFEVSILQRDADKTGLFAYFWSHANFEPILLRKDAMKPVLEGLRELSRTLLNRKIEIEKAG